jgi:serine/threonine protein kinase
MNSDSAIVAVPLLKSQEISRINLLPNIGDNFQGRYSILKHEGKGGQSSVFKARDNILGRLVALRFILPEKLNDQTNALFVSEGSILASLDHKNVVKIYDLSKGTNTFMVLEWLKGGNLKQLSEQKNKINETELINYIIPILEAISYLHQKKIIHRDIKLTNIFLTREGVLKIIDFGIAQEVFDINNTHSISGPIFFPAPIQAGTTCYRPNESEVNEKTDIYAIGLIMIYLICYGKENSPIKTENDLNKIKNIEQRKECMDFISRNSSDGFFEIVQSLTNLNPESRPTASDVLEQIRKLNKRIFREIKDSKKLQSNPYMSFYEFDENDANGFFGRSEEISNISTIFYKEKILILRGSSGSGKSSLIKAGLFPQLRYEKENIIISKIFSESIINQIIEAAIDNLNLEKTSLELYLDFDINKEIPQGKISEKLKKTIKYLYLCLKNSKKKIIIFIDKMEDVYSLNKDSQMYHKYLIDFLMNLTSFPQDLIKIIVSIKEDCFQFLESNEQMKNYLLQHPASIYLLRAPNKNQMLEMLNNPLKEINCHFELGLDHKIIDDINNDEQGRFAPLPLLQVVAKTLWDTRKENADKSSIITLDSFNKLNGVPGIFDSIYKNFIEIEFKNEKDQEIVQKIFLKILINRKQNKICKKEELLSTSSDENSCNRILNKFISKRLLIEVNGNILMVSGIFYDWYQQKIKGIEYNSISNLMKFEQMLKQYAYNWKEQGQPKSLLWKKDMISDLILYFGNKKFSDDIIQLFIDESIKKIRAKKTKKVAIWFAVFCLFLFWSFVLLFLIEENKKSIKENQNTKEQNMEIEKKIYISELKTQEYLILAEQYKLLAEEHKKNAEIEYRKFKYNSKKTKIIGKAYDLYGKLKLNLAIRDLMEAENKLAESKTQEEIIILQKNLDEKRNELEILKRKKENEFEFFKSKMEKEFLVELVVMVDKIQYESSILKKYVDMFDNNEFPCSDNEIKILQDLEQIKSSTKTRKNITALLKAISGKIW